MNSNNSDSLPDLNASNADLLPEPLPDPLLERQVQRLLQVQTYLRWLFDGLLWLTLGTASIWALRSEIEMWIATFTWAAVRATLTYNRLPMLGLGFCVAMTLATLVWQSSIILWGVSQKEKRSLIDQVKRIKAKGKSHPLWRWIFEENI